MTYIMQLMSAESEGEGREIFRIPVLEIRPGRRLAAMEVAVQAAVTSPTVSALYDELTENGFRIPGVHVHHI